MPEFDSSKIKKAEFLKLLEDLGSHSLYFPEPLVARLANCGLSVSLLPDGQGIVLEGEVLNLTEAEWGKPGISPSSILWTVYERCVGQYPESVMTGRGFWYKDVMTMLAKFWGIDKEYL